MKSRHLLTEIRTMQEKGILHPNDVYIWLLMAMTELDQGDSVVFSPDELSRATGLSRSSVFDPSSACGRSVCVTLGVSD